MCQTKHTENKTGKVVWVNKILYSSDEELTLWYNMPVTVYTDYTLQHSLIGVVLNKELTKHKIMLINNLFSSISGSNCLELNLCNLNERPYTLKQDQEIGIIVPIGK